MTQHTGQTLQPRNSVALRGPETKGMVQKRAYLGCQQRVLITMADGEICCQTMQINRRFDRVSDIRFVLR
jgi:hypothetical protein